MQISVLTFWRWITVSSTNWLKQADTNTSTTLRQHNNVGYRTKHTQLNGIIRRLIYHATSDDSKVRAHSLVGRPDLMRTRSAAAAAACSIGLRISPPPAVSPRHKQAISYRGPWPHPVSYYPASHTQHTVRVRLIKYASFI